LVGYRSRGVSITGKGWRPTDTDAAGAFSGNPGVEKARAEFESAQKIEETFYKNFDGIDFASREAKPQRSLPNDVF
jgi:hypothetical protein